MDTPAVHSIPLSLEQNGKKLPLPLDSQLSSSRNRTHHNHSNNNKDCADIDTDMEHASTSAQGNIHSHSYKSGRMSRSNSQGRTHGNGSGLSLREQQQQRNQQANNSNSSLNGSPASLTLSITPPKFMTNYLPVDPSSSQAYNNNNNSNDYSGPQQSLQNESNNSLLGGSHDSLGSSLSRPGNSSNTSRRASFNLSTGSLNFNSNTSSSMSSPSSPSYSTIAVARARAAAAAAAGGQGVTAGGDESGIIESGVFPGALGQNPFSSPSSSAPSSSTSQDLYSNSRQPHPHAPLSKSLTSSASSLLSDASVSSTGSGSVSSSTIQTHLQANAKAEREISMILDNFLYLGGDLVDEEQILEVERLGIKRVLNMAANCDDLLWVQRAGENNGSYLKVGLLDHVDQDLKVGLDKAVKFIASSTTPVYVHCQAGKSRSVATVIGYLIQEHKWPLKKAYDHVVERRRIVSPNIGFVSQLIMLEERVLGRDQAGGLVSTGEDANPASRTTVMPWVIS